MFSTVANALVTVYAIAGLETCVWIHKLQPVTPPPLSLRTHSLHHHHHHHHHSVIIITSRRHHHHHYLHHHHRRRCLSVRHRHPICRLYCLHRLATSTLTP